MPERIQRQRTKGWRMPEGAVYVGRPTAFGNPFPVDIYGQQGAVDLFRRWLRREMSAGERNHTSRYHESLTVAGTSGVEYCRRDAQDALHTGGQP